MSDTTLLENSMFSDATKRAALVADAPLCTSLFFINYLGFLGLYALNDSRGFMKNYEQTEKKLKINEIADDNHDVSLVIKLCVEAGVVNDGQVAQVTKLLALIKQRSIRAKDLDSVRVRELIEKTMMHNKPMSAHVKGVVVAFMTGAIDLKEYARQIYDVAKTNMFRDYTLEFRTLVVKGQYTDYFTVMKRGGTVAAPATQAGGVRAAAKPAALGPQVDKTALAVAQFEKLWRDNRGVLPQFFTQWFATSVSAVPVKDRSKFFQEVVDKVSNAVFEDFPMVVPSNLMGDSGEVAYVVAKRQAEVSLAKNDWNSTRGISEALYTTANFATLSTLKAEIAKAAVEGIKKHATPVDDKQWASWINVVHIAVSAGAAWSELEKIQADVDPKGTNHKVHLLSLPIRLGSNVKLVDPGDYGAKAMAWIRKWGPFAGNGNRLVSLRVSTAMTSTVWKAMSADDQAVWMSQNFNRAGADKADTWMNRDNYGNNHSYMKITPAARAAVIANLGDAWKDRSLVAAFASKNNRHRWLSIGAIAVADIMLKEKRAVNEAHPEYRSAIANAMFSTSRWGSPADSKTWPSPEIVALIESFDVKDAAEVQKLIEIGNSLSKTGFLHLLHPGGDKALGLSWVSKIAFASSSRVAGIDVSSTYVQIDNDALTAEAADWVRKYGKMFSRPVTVRDPAITDPEVAAEYCVIAACTDDLRGNPVEFDEPSIREIYKWSADKWTQVAARVVASGKHDTIFQYAKTRSYNYSGSIRGFDTDFTDFEHFIEGIRIFVMSNYDEELTNFSDVWADITYMTVPVREGVLKWAADKMKSYSSQYYYGQRFQFKSDDTVVALINSAIDQNLINEKTSIFVTTLLTDLAKKGMVNKDRVASVAAKLVAAGDTFKPILAGVLNEEMMSSPELFPAVRWAVSLTPDEVTAALKATQAGGSYGAYRLMAFDPAKAPGLSDEWRSTYYLGKGYNDKNIPVAAWADSMSDDDLAPNFTTITQYDFLTMVRTNINSPRMKEVLKAALLKALDAPVVPWSNDVSGGKTSRALEAMKMLGIDNVNVKKKYVQGSLDAMFAAKGSTPSDFATFVEEVDTALLTTAHITALVKKFASTDSKGAIAALAALAYDDDKKTVNADFIAAVRAAGNERAVISRLSKTLEVGSALDIINADPNGVPIQVDKARIDKFLKFNNVDMSKVVKVNVTRLEDFGTAKAQVSAVVPPLAMTEVKGDDVRKERIKLLHKSNKYNHSPALGLEVKRTFAVSIPGQKDRFDAWCKANPTTKIVTLFHGTGTINAAFILRFGFKIIASTDPSVTGRMLGDGIYFADNINKTMLYMSNAGYIRQDGQEGYVLKCLVALGQRPRNHREGNAERSGLVSNEWAVFSTDQILIQEAYYGVSRERKAITAMLNEAVRMPAYNVSTFMFMDGMVPVDKTMLVDFEGLQNLSKHVSIETSAKGPIVTIRHDTTVRPVHQCYRWGEEMQSAEHAKSLALFLKLLKNTY